MDEAEQVAAIEEVVLPIVRDHGLQLVDLEWRAVRPRAALRLFVDKRGGVAMADGERLSREIGDAIDAAAVIDEAYDLEVSSPGLDRQLRREREFRWAVGKRGRCWQGGGWWGGARGPRDSDEGTSGGGCSLAAQGVESGGDARGHEPRADQRHRADRTGEGDRQRGPLRGAGVCPALG